MSETVGHGQGFSGPYPSWASYPGSNEATSRRKYKPCCSQPSQSLTMLSLMFTASSSHYTPPVQTTAGTLPRYGQLPPVASTPRASTSAAAATGSYGQGYPSNGLVDTAYQHLISPSAQSPPRIASYNAYPGSGRSSSFTPSDTGADWPSYFGPERRRGTATPSVSSSTGSDGSSSPQLYGTTLDPSALRDENGSISRPLVSSTAIRSASEARRNRGARFFCQVAGCGSDFTTKSNLQGHMRSHAGEKPYECAADGCGKAFTRQSDCRRHEEKLHPGMNVPSKRRASADYGMSLPCLAVYKGRS